ncbi:methylated-DNA--protein-cysteine methyltransferase [[Candida] railenensis]|uniref:Methylated-DNA--protein-cysteine methyltransferase n=1 Tax=[Candida] railenensis TaxID=45579 RepID=A0A9P0QUC1_9ASCO|nr:methylated-DNA--protein-cysteine methyltransferase [[Candida] railenensis]
MLFYTLLDASYTRALLVLDLEGTLYYASLGNDERKLIFQMKTDFTRYNKKKNYGNVQLKKNIDNGKMLTTIELYRSLVENPGSSDISKIKFKMINGTELQYKVWDYLLQKTEPSKTTTYGNIAKYLQMSTFSSRAVGNACGANRIALVVPCHRVLGHTGEITGYKWGIGIKEEILKREKQSTLSKK